MIIGICGKSGCGKSTISNQIIELANNKVNTICLFANKEYQFISSSMVKEVLDLDKDISRYVDPIVMEKC